MRAIASFLRYTAYLNFINGNISRVLLQILVYLQLLSRLFFRRLASLRFKPHVIKYCTTIYERNGKINFGL